MEREQRIRTLGAAGCAALFFILLLGSAAHAETALPAKSDSGGFIRDWLLLGPMHSAGLTRDSAREQEFCRPNAGDLFLAPDARLQWTLYQSPKARVDLLDAFPNYQVHTWPAGYPAVIYAHVYVLVPAVTNCAVEVRGDVNTVHVLLNGRMLPRGDGDTWTGALQRGVNRLLLKIYGFQQPRPWRFYCRILGSDGAPAKGPRCFINNPLLDPAELAQRNRPDFKPGEAPADRIKRNLHPVNCPTPFFLWYDDVPVSMDLVVGYRTDAEMKALYGGQTAFPEWEQVEGIALVEVVDIDGEQAFAGKFPAVVGPDRPARLRLDMGVLPRGHYTVRLRLARSGGGWLLNTDSIQTPRFSPMQFGVISHETNHTDPEESKMGCSWYWIAAADGPEERHRRLLLNHLMGVRFQLSTRSWYWAGKSPEDFLTKDPAEWNWTPSVDGFLAAAKEFGMEVVGDLDGWWPVHGSPASSASAFTRVTDPEVAVCWFEGGWWQLIGRYDDPKAAEIVRKYTYECVKRYKDRIRYWKFHNELNLFRGAGFTPEFYGHLLKVAAEAAREADPNCVIINASVSGPDTDFIGRLIDLGYAPCFDIVDVHTYSWGHHGGGDLLAGPVEALLQQKGLKKPIIIGETGHHRYYPDNAVMGQLYRSIQWFTYAMALPWMDKVCWGINGGPPWCVTDVRGAPYPGYLGLRTAALMIDGGEFVGTLQDSPVTGYVFKKNGGYVTAVWSGSRQQITFDQDVTVVDAMDRRKDLDAGTPTFVDGCPSFVMSSEPPSPRSVAPKPAD